MVGNINNRDSGIDTEYNPFHCSHVSVPEPKISGQGNDGSTSEVLLKQSLMHLSETSFDFTKDALSRQDI